MKRRTLLQSAVATGTAAALVSNGEANEPPLRIIDTNVSLFHWPFRRLPLDETDRLLGKMTDLGIAQALAGSFEGIFHRDIRAVNQRLARACTAHESLIPIGSINPGLPDWEDDLKRCREEWNMPGIRLHPNYHGYAFGDHRFVKLLALASQQKLFIQVVAAFEDTRTQPFQLQVPGVDLAPLPDLVKHSGLQVQVLNWRPRGAVLETLAKVSEIHFDTARVEGTDGVATLLKSVPAERVLFGSHAPFLVPEASLIRVRESDLPDAALRAIMETNANRFLTG